MKRITIAIAAGALALGATSCSSSDDEPQDKPAASSSSAPDEQLVDVTSGRPLSEFKGMPSYEWRKTIAEDQDRLLGEMQAIAPHLEAKDFSDVLGTCDSIARGLDQGKVIDEAVVRFSGSPEEQVTVEQAKDLVALAEEVCPA